jgi:hypothetical protein
MPIGFTSPSQAETASISVQGITGIEGERAKRELSVIEERDAASTDREDARDDQAGVSQDEDAIQEGVVEPEGDY